MRSHPVTVAGYIYLADVPDWHADHPEALARLHEQAPPGARWTTAGNDGAWWEATIDRTAPSSEEEALAAHAAAVCAARTDWLTAVEAADRALAQALETIRRNGTP